MKNDTVTVLDLGTTKVAGLLASTGESDVLRIHGVAAEACRGIRKGIVTDLEETTRCIEVVLAKLREANRQESAGVVVSVTGSHLEGINAQGYVPIYPRSRSITREDVLQVIKHSRQVVLSSDREQIQAIPREFQVDGQKGVQRPVGMVGSRLEVVTYIVTGETTPIQNVEKAINMAGKKVDNMVLEGLASGLGVLSQEEMNTGAIVVDIGGGSTSVAMFSGGSIVHSAFIPAGGMLVTSDVSKLLKTSIEEAERLKLIYGSADPSRIDPQETVSVLQTGQDHPRPMQRKVLCEIIESRMREIASLVRQALERSEQTNLVGCTVVLTGGGAMLAGTERVFEETLQHSRVRSAEPDIPEMALTGHSFATAVGLARFAIECAEDELVPAGGGVDWKDRIRTIWSVIKR